MRWAIAVGLTLTAACRKHARDATEAEPTPPTVRCVAASASIGDDSIEIRGAIAPPPRAQAVVAAPVSGRLARILVEEGDVVTVGQLVAVVDDPTLGASALESSSEVAAAQAELQAATADRSRRETLVTQGIAPQRELDEARAREAAAAARVAGANAHRQLARGNLSRAELRAPRAGVVLHVFHRAGEIVDSASPAIVEIADLSVLELRAQITGAELVGVIANAPATVRFDALPELEVTGVVVAIAPALDAATTLGTVRVRLTSPEVHLAIGLPGVATIHRSAQPAITIPATAVRRSLAGTDEVLVCVGSPAAKVEVRAVTVGRRAGTTVAVDGIGPGDRVVADHVLTLEDAAPIVEAAGSK